MAGWELIIFGVLFGGGALFCLGWMMVNLFGVMNREGISWDVSRPLGQSSEFLLKPAIVFFLIGALASIYLWLRVEPVVQ